MGWFYGKGTRSEGAKKGGGWRVAGKMLRRGKGRGCGFEGERFLKMWNRMYIYIRPSQDKSRQETSLLPSRTRQMKEEEKKQQKKPQKKEKPQKKAQRKEEYNHKK